MQVLFGIIELLQATFCNMLVILVYQQSAHWVLICKGNNCYQKTLPMKKLIYILILMVPVVITAQPPWFKSSPSENTWVNVGNPGFSAGGADYSNIVIGPDQKPYTAYNDAAFGMRASVMKYDGTSWLNVGTAGFTPAQADRISLALSPGGTPYIAFLDYVVSKGVSVMKYNGSTWEYVGDTGFSNSNSEWPRIAFSPSGEPYVSFIDENHISVMKYNGSQWIYIGPRKFSDQCYFDDMSFSPADGLPYVTYDDFPLGDRATLDKFDGTNWVHVGNPGFSAGGFAWLNLAFDQEGQPYVGYCDFTTQYDKLTVMTYNGSSWQNLGNPGFNPGYPQYPALAVGPDNLPCIVYDQYIGKTSAMKFNGSDWVFVGDTGFSAGGAERLDIAIDSLGRIYVAYADFGNGGRETVMKYDTISVGVIEHQKSQLSIYPNPATDKIIVEKAELSTPGHLIIANLSGQEFLQLNVTGQITIVDISTIPSGVYLVKLVDEKGVQVRKIIRQ